MRFIEKKHKASLTVEASLAFPLFIFAIAALMCFFSFMETEYSIERSMFTAARKVSAYGDLLEVLENNKRDIDDAVGVPELISNLAEAVPGMNRLLPARLLMGLVDSAVISEIMESEINLKELGRIEGGAAGISYLGSELYTADESIHIKCSYSLRVPIVFFDMISIPMEQELTYRYFTGHRVFSLLEEIAPETPEEEKEEEEDPTVFITDTGNKVYHSSRDCPCLKLVTRTVAFSRIEAERNIGGGKYYACEKCARGSPPANVIIPEDGRKYHYDSNCAGLKRTIYEVKLSSVKDRRACKRCK